MKGHEERISAIANEYAKSPESTLVVSPDNRSRTEINQRIHDELQSRGVVSREEHSVQTLVQRQEMTGADRGWAQQYQVNDIVRYSRSSHETGIEKGEYTRVVNVNAQEHVDDSADERGTDNLRSAPPDGCLCLPRTGEGIFCRRSHPV